MDGRLNGRGLVVAVCGGRNYNNEDGVFNALDRYSYVPKVTVVTGGAQGADALAEFLAKRFFGFSVAVENADWKTEGKAAGPLRNERLLEHWHPDVLLAFPGGRGTADMVERARTKGIPVLELGG